MSYCHSALSVRPSTVVRRQFSHFWLLLQNHLTDSDETWQKARTQRPLPSLWGFFATPSSKMAALASDWLEHFSTSSPQPLNEFWRNLTGSKSSTPSIKFVFFVPIGSPRWQPWPLIGWNILRLLLSNRWMDFDETTGSKSSTPSIKFVFFVLIGNPRWPPWPLIGWNIFGFFSATAERILTKFDRTQVLNALHQVCVLCRSEIQDGRPGLWLAETFFDFFSATAERILTKLDGKQVLYALYQVCVFLADRKSKMAALAFDWLKHFSTSYPQPLNGFWRNLIDSKSSTPSIRFVFFVPIGNPRWPPGLWLAETFFDFFSATAEWILTKLDRKQFIKALYQVCVFRADQKFTILWICLFYSAITQFWEYISFTMSVCVYIPLPLCKYIRLNFPQYSSFDL